MLLSSAEAQVPEQLFRDFFGRVLPQMQRQLVPPRVGPPRIAPGPQASPAPVPEAHVLTSGPTFDCAKATSSLGLLICSDSEAARADWDLVTASWARYFSLNENDRPRFSRDQDQWFASVGRKCQLASHGPPFARAQISCVIGAYRGRAAAYRSKLTGDALAELRLSPEQLVQIQQALITGGYLDDNADGEFGPGTRNAIRQYQEATRLSQSNYLSTAQRQALLAGSVGTTGVGNDPSITAENRTVAGSATAANPRPLGEFARVMQIPADCQTAHELGQSKLWIYLPFHGQREPGPTCRAVVSCLRQLKSQLVAGIDYLRQNPPAFDVFRRNVLAASPANGNYLLSNWFRAMATGAAGSRFEEMARSNAFFGPKCDGLWHVLNHEWLPEGDFSFKTFSAAGLRVLKTAHSDYTADENEYRELIAFNDRYTGVEELDRAYASYRKAFEQDDIAGILGKRPAMLEGLRKAPARKELLMQQSAALAQYDQTLANFISSIDREGLTNFGAQQTQPALQELRSEVGGLSQTEPSRRGDVSAKLELFATQMKHISAAISSARSVKNQAEQTRRMLVDSEGEVKRVLKDASSEELKGVFDEKFINSISKLSTRFGRLASRELWALHEMRDEIDAAMRELGVLKNQISDAQARYERAKRLDGMRQANMQRIARALSEFAQPEI